MNTLPTKTIAEKLPETLVINRNDSKCGACGMGAFPSQETHIDVAGWKPRPGEGCGVRWRYLTSDYVGEGIEEAAREMRPDLEWFDRWPGFGEKAA